MPRGVGAVQVNTTSNSSARSADSISFGSRPLQDPDHQDLAAGGIEVFEEHLRARVGARRVVRAVDDHQWLVTEHLEAAGHAHIGETFADDVVGERCGEERLDSGERDDRHCRLGGGRAAARTHRCRSSSVFAGRPCGRRARAGSRAHRTARRARSTLSPPASVKYGSSSGSVSPTDHDASGLDDARLLGGDVALGRARRTRCGPCRCW